MLIENDLVDFNLENDHPFLLCLECDLMNIHFSHEQIDMYISKFKSPKYIYLGDSILKTTTEATSYER